MAVIGIGRTLGAPQAQPAAIDNSDGSRLVAKLRTVADRGLLYEPQAMAEVLGLKVHFSEERKTLELGKCSDGRDRPLTKITSGRFENGWYKPGPEGIQNMKLPQAFINPAGQAGEPSISYEMYRSTRCDDGDYERIEARLTFDNLSGFSCLMPDRLKTQIGAEYYMATDGFSGSIYRPPATDRYGVTLDFLFRMGAPCALAARIDQETRRGKREERALAKWAWCVFRAKQEFCQTHRDLKPEENDQLKTVARKACGTEETFLQKEPLSGPPADPLPKVKYRAFDEPPCRE